LILRAIKLDWIACAATRLCQPRCRAVTTTATAAAAAVTASHINHKSSLVHAHGNRQRSNSE
jgi:hypothetical protein